MNEPTSIETELRELRAEVGRLRDELDARAPRPSRRQLFQQLGAVGTAALVGGIVADTAPAAAAPATFQTETVNNATAATELRYTGTGGYSNLLFVQDGVWGTRPTTDRSSVFMAWSGNWATNAVMAVSSSADGYAIEARGEYTTASGLLVSGRQAAIRFTESPDVLAPPLTFKAHNRGEVQYDKNGTLWFCTATSASANSPGTWRVLSGPGTAGAFHVLASPTRVYSSRDTGAAKLAAGEERVVSLSAAVPEGATAALLNLTLTQTGAPGGYVAVLAANAVWQNTSNINWTGADIDIANSAVSALDPVAAVKLRGGGAPTHVIVDVFGYWR